MQEHRAEPRTPDIRATTAQRRPQEKPQTKSTCAEQEDRDAGVWERARQPGGSAEEAERLRSELASDPTQWSAWSEDQDQPRAWSPQGAEQEGQPGREQGLLEDGNLPPEAEPNRAVNQREVRGLVDRQGGS